MSRKWNQKNRHNEKNIKFHWISPSNSHGMDWCVCYHAYPYRQDRFPREKKTWLKNKEKLVQRVHSPDLESYIVNLYSNIKKKQSHIYTFISLESSQRHIKFVTNWQHNGQILNIWLWTRSLSLHSYNFGKKKFAKKNCLFKSNWTDRRLSDLGQNTVFI